MRIAAKHVDGCRKGITCCEKVAVLPAGAWWGVDSLRVGLHIWMECLSREVWNVRCRTAFLGLPAASALILQLCACSACCAHDGHTAVLTVVLSCCCLCLAVLDLC